MTSGYVKRSIPAITLPFCPQYYCYLLYIYFNDESCSITLLIDYLFLVHVIQVFFSLNVMTNIFIFRSVVPTQRHKLSG